MLKRLNISVDNQANSVSQGREERGGDNEIRDGDLLIDSLSRYGSWTQDLPSSDCRGDDTASELEVSSAQSVASY